MEITVDRAFKKADYTISHLLVNGSRFCETCEDTDRGLTSKTPVEEIKRIKALYPGRTAIPSGRYQVIVNMSTRFKKLMPLLVDVPGYAGVRIHPGNTAKDTEGCILPGRNTIKGGVADSRIWYNKLFEMINKAIDKKEKVFITIK